MSWPISVEFVVLGTKFKRTWTTRTGKKKFQIRQVIEVGQMQHYLPQMNRDCCKYRVVDGVNCGREGQCTRLALSSWADEIVG